MIKKKNLMLYGIQPARPYLLGMRGSKSYFANFHFNGLGYQVELIMHDMIR
ncbi:MULTISPECIES: hypothetical protein [unclassified Pseudoalteromonas]|uniref:hypothetical protein n=1 Tax=unclassified Pseudoalteromonas TaxID=194690 RepID=UPI0012FC87C9|nr:MULTISPECIES: hypothetical protein [unclassified Pseudoalteromonas]